ncbi:unnamed protein product [Pleuronectes platessa]|uniref:Uncharacterized protein n=1 Tax=Pleuronectes platessa TaxID=8262 RepID=A0A9N7Y9C8_PLEPL|nr:unnamed protein product [Pleuronectes platessa]
MAGGQIEATHRSNSVKRLVVQLRADMDKWRGNREDTRPCVMCGAIEGREKPEAGKTARQDTAGNFYVVGRHRKVKHGIAVVKEAPKYAGYSRRKGTVVANRSNTARTGLLECEKRDERTFWDDICVPADLSKSARVNCVYLTAIHNMRV